MMVSLSGIGAFLALGDSLEKCANEYRKFCHRYKPKPKSEKCYQWGTKLLPKILKKKDKTTPGQIKLPWDSWEADNPEITAVAEKFVMANCYKPQVAAQKFN